MKNRYLCIKKFKNETMTDIETIENSPQRMSMRHTHYREKYDMKIYDQGTQNYKIVGRYIDRYLKKSIGRNYNKVKEHILEKMKDYNVARREPNVVETTLNSRVEFKEGDTRLKEYVIDSQGRLQINKKEAERTQYWIDKKKERRTTVATDVSNAMFFLRPDLTENQTLLLRTVLVDNGITLGDWFHHICCGGKINREKYDSIINHIKNERTEVNKHGYKWYDETSHARDFVESCFMVEGQTRYYYEYKSPEYRKWKKETLKQKKKEHRDRLKNWELKNETLLHDLENEKKRKELVKNIVDRDRLGFDENSFIGEPYHGQKRKK